MSISKETRIELIFLFAQNNELRALKTKHHLHKNPFEVTTIQRLVTRFKATGSVADLPGKGRKSTWEERETNVKDAVTELTENREIPTCSTREVAAATGFSQTNVYNILTKHLKWFPYRIKLHQEITTSDKQHRLEFANFILSNQNLIPQILWSDESNFSIDGSINRHNCAKLESNSC